MGRGRSLAAGVGLFAVMGACSAGDGLSPAPPLPPASAAPLTRAEAMDPASCAGCHAGQYGAWSTSMHAQASDDPLFVAMNARAQRDTAGAIGDFCVGCHAPLAVRTGAVQGGGNVAALPASLRGVTCFFCHSVDAVTGAHDDALALGDDGVLRGPIDDPVAGARHASAYSAIHDRKETASASLCGSCHDLRTPGGLDVERTFTEWSGTVFAGGASQKTCGNCHMAETTGPAASVPGAPPRPIHDHAMVGLDVPLGAVDPAASRAVQSHLDPALDARLCVTAAGSADVTLTNTRVGHAWPTGAAHDRRAWVELVAYAAGSVVFESGVLGSAASAPPALSFQETLFGMATKAKPARPVLFLWEAASSRTTALPPTTTFDPSLPGFDHARDAHYSIPATADRVTARVLVTPVAPEVVDALVASGDLDPGAALRIPVYALASTSLEWTADRGDACLP